MRFTSATLALPFFIPLNNDDNDNNNDHYHTDNDFFTSRRHSARLFYKAYLHTI